MPIPSPGELARQEFKNNVRRSLAKQRDDRARIRRELQVIADVLYDQHDLSADEIRAELESAMKDLEIE